MAAASMGGDELLEEALDRAGRIRLELAQLKAHALHLTPGPAATTAGCQPAGGPLPPADSTCRGHSALSPGMDASAAASPHAAAFAEPAPSAQPSLLPGPGLPAATGEQRVPPKSASDRGELPWQIAAVGSRPGSAGATAWQQQQQRQQADSASSGAEPSISLSPNKQAPSGGRRASRRSTFSLPQPEEEPRSVTGSIDFAALAAALQKEQQDRLAHQGSRSGSPVPCLPAAAARKAGPGRPLLAASSAPQLRAGNSGAGRSPRQQGGTYAGLHRSANERRGQPEGVPVPQHLQQWSESQALQKLLQKLEQANAVKQASDARVRRAATPRVSANHKQAAGGGRAVVAAPQAPRAAPAAQRRTAPPPKARTQPFVPKPMVAAGQATAPPQPPPTAARRESRRSTFSLAGLVGVNSLAALEPGSSAQQVDSTQHAAGGSCKAAAPSGYGQTASAAKTASVARAAGGVLASPRRQPAAGAQPLKSPARPASLRPLPQPPARPASHTSSAPLGLVPQPAVLQPRSPPAPQQQQQQQTGELETVLGGGQGFSVEEQAERSGRSKASDEPLRAYYSRLTSGHSSGIQAGAAASAQPSRQGSEAAEGSVRLAAASSSAAVDVGPLPAVAPGPSASVGSQPDGAVLTPAPAAPAWSWPAQHNQQQRPALIPGQAQVGPALPAAAKNQRGLLGLLGKLSPFGKLQSPPATPMDASQPQGRDRIRDAQARPNAAATPLPMFPDLSTAPVPAVQQPASQAPTQGPAAGSLSAQHQEGQQQLLGEDSWGGDTQAHAGMKRAPPGALEPPGTSRKRTPPPSRGASRGSEAGDGVPQWPGLLAAAQPASGTQQPQPPAPAPAGTADGGKLPTGASGGSAAAAGDVQCQAQLGREDQRAAKQRRPASSLADSRPSSRPSSRAASMTVVPPVCAIARSPVKQASVAHMPQAPAPAAAAAASEPRPEADSQQQPPAAADVPVNGAPTATAAPDPDSPAALPVRAGELTPVAELLPSTSILVPPLRDLPHGALADASCAAAAQQQQQERRHAGGSPASSPRRLLSQASSAGRTYAEMHYARPTLSSSFKQRSLSDSPSQSPRQHQPPGGAAWKPPSSVPGSPSSPPRSPSLSSLRQPSLRMMSYAERAAARQTLQQGHRTASLTTASTEAHPMAGGGAAGPAALEGSPGRGQHPGTDPASPLLSPSKELPSESTWHPAAETTPHPTEAAAAAPPTAPAGSSGGPCVPEVTVLIGGIHAVHRQKSLQRAAGGSGAARRPSSAAAELAAAATAEEPAAAGSEGVIAAAGGSAGPARQASGVPLPAVMAHRPGHARQPSMVPSTPGLPLREDELGRALLEGSPKLGSMAAGELVERLAEGSVVRKSWVRSDLKQGGSMRLVQCLVAPPGRVVLQYPHGLLRKRLQCTVKRVIIPAGPWKDGQYLVVDTAERGMLRIAPSSQAQYALWVLGLNAALTLAQQPGAGGNGAATAAAGGCGSVRAAEKAEAGAAGGGGSLQLVGDMQWSAAFMIG